MRRVFPALFFLPIAFSFARADDLRTRDGTVYRNYKVIAHDAQFVTIIYAEGGGKVPLSQLPDDLQKKYGYQAPAGAATSTAAASTPSAPATQEDHTPEDLEGDAVDLDLAKNQIRYLSERMDGMSTELER